MSAFDTVIVTRHQALVEYLIEIGLASTHSRVIEHATEFDVAGRRCIGVLPLRLALLASSVVEIPLNLPPELRGKELSLDQVRAYAGAPVEYVVKRV